MRTILSMLAIAAAVATLAAQPKPAVQPGTFQDSLQQENSALDQRAARLALRERQLSLQEKEQELDLRKSFLDQRFRARIEELRNPGRQPWGSLPVYTLLRHLLFLKLLFLGILFIATINILLTIAVCLDMSQRGRFNGLWVPLLLLAGIPVSVIYALFRAGDIIATAHSTTSGPR